MSKRRGSGSFSWRLFNGMRSKAALLAFRVVICEVTAPCVRHGRIFCPGSDFQACGSTADLPATLSEPGCD